MKRRLILTILVAGFTMLVNAQVTNDLYMNIPPGIDPENELVKMGYLDVTLYGADSTGNEISTSQIKQAIRDARDYQLTCYIPSGTYLVDDTITGMMNTRNLQTGGTVEYSDIRYPITIVGARNPRPVIKLTGPGSMYQNPDIPRPLFWLWSKNGRSLSTNPLNEQSNIFYNSTLKNLIIDVRGYPGAEGVRFSAAQGSTIEDVTVLADGAYAGFHGSVGQGGGTYNVEVIGGLHGFVYDDGVEQKFVTIAGSRFINQTAEVFKIFRMGMPMSITGFYIEKEDGNIFGGSPVKGGISLVDGVINYAGPTVSNNLFSTVNSNLYVENVYVNNGNKVAYSDGLSSSGWDLVEEYYLCNSTKGMNLINGENHTNNVLTMTPGISAEEVPEAGELILKHTWDNDNFISIEDRAETDFINVKDPVKMSENGGPGAASGNAVDDDTEKIQWAIDNYDRVFIPKGRFVINKSLLLRANTQLFGAGKVYAIIRAGANWDASLGKSMIRTVEDAAGTASISFLMLETDYRQNKDLTRLEWHLGRNSLVKDVSISVELQTQKNKFYHYHNMIEISGSTAGGRFYGIHGDYTAIRGLTAHKDYRHILISGTREPLRLYGCNAERAQGEGQINVIDSRDVHIYFLKSESASMGDGSHIAVPNVALMVKNSENVNLYAYSGYTELENDMAIVEFHESANVLAANMVKSNTTGSETGWNYIREFSGNSIFRIPAYKQVALYKRDENDLQPRIYFDFESVLIDTLEISEGASWEGIVENPVLSSINESDHVGLFFRGNSPGEFFFYHESNTIDLTETQTFTLDVFSDSAGTVEIRLEDSENSEVNVTKKAAYTTPGKWANLRFYFSGSLNHTYSRVTIIPGADVNDPEKWYLDNLKGPKLTPLIPDAIFSVVATNSSYSNFRISIDNSINQIVLSDDGTNGDETASDGIWTTTVPGIPLGSHVYDVYAENLPVGGGDDIAFTISESPTPVIIPPFYYTGIVLGPRAPFGAEPIGIPGRVEAENFDLGGEGVAFGVQTNPLVGDYYRPESDVVGTEKQDDGAITIGFTGADEWLEYAVDVTAGDYIIKTVYSTGIEDIADERGIKVFLDEIEIFDFDTSNVGGDWKTFLEFSSGPVSLPESPDGILKILWKTGGFNLDYIEFTEWTNTNADNRLTGDTEQFKCYPNPFSDKLHIDFQLEKSSDVQVSIYKITGKKVYEWRNNNMIPGKHTFRWDGKASNGQTLSDGMYLINLITEDLLLTRSVIRN